MGYIIGMDEAGYGPNLGPLVVSLTVWRVPGDPRDVDLWTTFSPLVTAEPATGSDQVQIADSKKVYSTARGLKALERGVWSALRHFPAQPTSWRGLLDLLTERRSDILADEPWFADADLPIPHEHDLEESRAVAEAWQARRQETNCELKIMRSDLMLTDRWNQITRRLDSKGLALTHTSLELLRGVWNPSSDEPALIIADKHGGRNRYAAILSELFDGRLFNIVQESREASVYRVGPHTLRFEQGAERHLPVALASMIGKYLRELSMILFNRYWSSHLLELKPTQGYPEDARRFLNEIRHKQEELGIPFDTLWRER